MSTSTTSTKTDQKYLVDFSSRLKVIEDKLEKNERSFIRRFGVWGGLVALIISIIAGGIGIYDRIQTEIDKHDQNVVVASEIAEKLNSISTEFIKVQSEKDPEKLYRLSMLWNAEISRHISNLQAMGDAVIRDMRSADLLVLSYHFLNQNFPEQSIKISDFALANAPNELMRAEAFKHRAIAKFAKQDVESLQSGRQDMAEAMNIIKGHTGPNGDGTRSGIFLNWILLEAVAGQCEAARDIFQNYVNMLESLPNAHPLQAGRDMIEADLARRSKCSF